MEHTVGYTKGILNWLITAQMNVWLESSLAIKRSMGLTRGKNDRIDAQRIALYAYRFEDQCVLWQAPRKEIQELEQLQATRDRLIKVIKTLEVPLAGPSRRLCK